MSLFKKMKKIIKDSIDDQLELKKLERAAYMTELKKLAKEKGKKKAKKKATRKPGLGIGINTKGWE